MSRNTPSAKVSPHKHLLFLNTNHIYYSNYTCWTSLTLEEPTEQWSSCRKVMKLEVWKHFDFSEFRIKSSSSEQLLPSSRHFIRHTPLQSQKGGERRGPNLVIDTSSVSSRATLHRSNTNSGESRDQGGGCSARAISKICRKTFVLIFLLSDFC